MSVTEMDQKNSTLCCSSRAEILELSEQQTPLPHGVKHRQAGGMTSM